jgi:hypothetical protein
MYGVDDLRHRHTITSPDAETTRDSVRDIASEQREARGSLGNMRLGRLKVPDVPEPVAAFVFREVAGFVGGLREGAA